MILTKPPDGCVGICLRTIIARVKNSRAINIQYLQRIGFVKSCVHIITYHDTVPTRMSLLAEFPL